MALDTRGLASGFTQGFGLMNQYQQQERQNERQDKQDAMQAEQYEMQKEQMATQQEQAVRAQDMEDLQFTLAKGLEFGPDSLSETEIDLLKNKPQVWSAFDDQADPAIQRAAEVFDPSSPVDANDPESLGYANVLFQDLVNRGEGGQKRIAGFYPAPDGQSVNIELEVTREDGSVDYQPMTDGRGTEEDATVMNVPVEKLTNHIQGLRQIRNGINMGGDEFKDNASRMLRLLRGDSQESFRLENHPQLGMVQVNEQTGEINPVRPGAGSPYDRSGSGGSSKPPSRIQEAQELVSRGVYETFADAYEAVRARAGQQNGVAQNELEYYSGRLDELNETLNNRVALQLNGDEIKQMREERQAIQKRLPDLESQAFGREAPGSSNPPPEPDPKKSTLPDDDELLKDILRDL